MSDDPKRPSPADLELDRPRRLVTPGLTLSAALLATALSAAGCPTVNPVDDDDSAVGDDDDSAADAGSAARAADDDRVG